MNHAELDSLNIQRDALLDKKRIIDEIDKIRLRGSKNQIKFNAHLSNFNRATNIQDRDRIVDLINGIQSEQIAYFKISQGSRAEGWGSDPVTITIGERFIELTEKIRSEYDDINKKLGKDKIPFNFADYDFHQRIKKVSQKQFKVRHYKDAILNSFIEVITRVKEVANSPKNGRNRDMDGDDLMNHTFGCDNQTPMIKLNELTTDLDKAEQRGFMYLYKGICGIRDKKAHLNFVQNNPSITIEYLSLASLLMRLLDDDYLSQYNLTEK